MIAIDKNKIIAVLIGASEFPFDTTITSIPNIKQNITEWKNILSNSDYLGLPTENIYILLNESAENIDENLKRIVQKITNKEFTFLLYYTGHGIFGKDDNKLYLTAYNTKKISLKKTSISVEDLKEVLDKCKAGQKVVIIDSCFSGNFAGKLASVNDQLSAEIEHTFTKSQSAFVMTSSGETETSDFDPNNPYLPTDFTNALLSTMQKGIDNESEFLTFNDIFNEIEPIFIKKFKNPQKKIFQQGDKIGFIYNRFYLNNIEIKQAWEYSAKIDTIESYKEFINNYPNSNFSIRAEKLICDIEKDEIFWVDICKNGKFFEYFDKVLKGEIKGKYIANAKAEIMRIKGESEDTPEFKIAQYEELFLNFFSDYSISLEEEKALEAFRAVLNLPVETANEIKNRLTKKILKEKRENYIKTQQEKYNALLESFDIEEYQIFISEYKSGKLVNDIRERLFNYILEQNSIELFKDYVLRYKTGKYVEVIRKIIYDFDIQTDKIDTIQNYIFQNSNSQDSLFLDAHLKLFNKIKSSQDIELYMSYILNNAKFYNKDIQIYNSIYEIINELENLVNSQNSYIATQKLQKFKQDNYFIYKRFNIESLLNQITIQDANVPIITLKEWVVI